jgi:DNA-binding beta-propeller fold protein YncE
MRATLIPLFIVSLAAAGAEPGPPSGVPLALPGVTGGIGFDDLQLSPATGLVLVPAGRSGRLFLVDPKTRGVSEIGGFSPTGGKFEGGHGEGITSVAEGGGRLYVTDRTSLSLLVVDPQTKAIVARTKLAASPDYVRWVAPGGEIWVTEPDKDQIEVFTASDPGGAPVHAALIAVPGGPESLVVDAARGRAYAHLWKGKTIALDVAGRRIAETWDNRCEGSRGIALDEAKHFVFAACSEGRVVTLDAAHGGRVVGDVKTRANGVDIVDYDPARHHLYVPGGKSASLSIVSVAPDGSLTELGSSPSPASGHCAVTDRQGRAYVCDPPGGRLVVFEDPYPATAWP